MSHKGKKYVPLNMIGVYFESWACPWTDSADKCKLSDVDADRIFIAFADPKTTYQKGQNNWNTTGLNFSMDFSIIVESIKKCKTQGKQVFLSVGGATYSFDPYNIVNVKWLTEDLGCDGIDLDFEPLNPVESQDLFIQFIKNTKSVWNKPLCIAAFAAGCLSPLNGDVSRGSMIKVLQQVGDKLDFINLMNYDAGKSWDYKAVYLSYKPYFSKPIFFGLEVGPQGWGDALLTLDDVKEVFQYLAPTDGWFVWAYFKDGNPNYKQVVQYIRSLSPPSAPLPTPSPAPPLLVLCPNCRQGIIEIRTK